jgi:hypothetical protein
MALAEKRGVTLEVFLGKLRLRAESEPDESLVRLLRDNKQAVIEAFLAAETEPARWRRRLAEKIETIVTIRGLSQASAKAEAFKHVVIEYMDETHPDTDPRVCAHCHGPNLPLTPTVPIGVGERHAWLHQRCWEPWSERRRAEAVVALAKMGIIAPTLPTSASTSSLAGPALRATAELAGRKENGATVAETAGNRSKPL